MRFPIDIILVCIRWYAAYLLSYRHLEEMMLERGVFVDHSSINRWAIRFLQLLEKSLLQAQARGGLQLAHGQDLLSWSKAPGNTCTAPWTRKAGRLTLC